MKGRILYLSTLPPPYYGASVLSKKCLDILEKSGKFELEHIKLNYSKEMSDVGKINISKIKGILSVRRQIKDRIRKFKPSLIFFAPATSSLGLIRDYSFIKLIKERKLPILYHIHSRISIKDRTNPIFNMMYKQMFSKQRAIVLGKELLGDINWIIPKKDIFVLPNASENELTSREFERVMKKRRERDSFNILFLSNMDKTKGWPKILEACKILKQNKVQFKCNFVGAWPSDMDKEEFNRFIVKNDLAKQVSYLGKMTGQEKSKILVDSDLLIFPTEYKLETFGLVILEAMMYGLPVIANGIAAIPSIIENNKTGIVLKKNTPEEIAIQIQRLSNNRLRERMGILGRKRFLDSFEMNEYSKKLVKIVESQI